MPRCLAIFTFLLILQFTASYSAKNFSIRELQQKNVIKSIWQSSTHSNGCLNYKRDVPNRLIRFGDRSRAVDGYHWASIVFNDIIYIFGLYIKPTPDKQSSKEIAGTEIWRSTFEYDFGVDHCEAKEIAAKFNTDPYKRHRCGTAIEVDNKMLYAKCKAEVKTLFIRRAVTAGDTRFAACGIFINVRGSKYPPESVKIGLHSHTAQDCARKEFTNLSFTFESSAAVPIPDHKCRFTIFSDNHRFTESKLVKVKDVRKNASKVITEWKVKDSRKFVNATDYEIECAAMQKQINSSEIKLLKCTEAEIENKNLKEPEQESGGITVGNVIFVIMLVLIGIIVCINFLPMMHVICMCLADCIKKRFPEK